MDDSQASVLEFAHAVNAIRFCQVAACAVVLYEHLTTLDLEVELIWRKEWTVVKVLFLISRYVGNMVTIGFGIVYILPLPPSHHWFQTCKQWAYIQGWGGVAISASLQAIMQYRISIMYGNSRRMIAFMVVCLICEAVASSVIFGIHNRDSSYSTEPIPELNVCMITSSPPYYYTFWIPLICLDAILFGLALRAGIQWHISERTNSTRSYGVHSPRLWYLLLRDSISFPFITLTVYIVNLMSYRFLAPHWFEIGSPFASLICRLLGCRLILNLRDAYYLPFNFEVDSAHMVPFDFDMALRNIDTTSVRIPEDFV